MSRLEEKNGENVISWCDSSDTDWYLEQKKILMSLMEMQRLQFKN